MTMDEYMNALLSDEVMNEERSMFKKAHDYGREEGIDIGKNEGKKEAYENIAKEMLKSNMPMKDIIKLAKLSEKEILNLKNNM